MPKLSIITVTYNAEETVSDTLLSVQNQGVTDIEHILVDGASTDKTVELVKACQKTTAYPVRYLSEPDQGLYDAMNKGLTMAKGEFIHFLNADDSYVNDQVLANLLPKMTEQKVYHGNLQFVEEKSVVIRIGGPCGAVESRFPKNVHQPALFAPREAYQLAGEFDLRYRIAADFDMTVRLLRLGMPFVYVGFDIVRMAGGGLSDRQVFTGYCECANISNRHGRPWIFSQYDYLCLSLKRVVKMHFPIVFKIVRQYFKRNRVDGI